MKTRYRVNGDIETSELEWIDKGAGISHREWTVVGKVQGVDSSELEKLSAMEANINRLYNSMIDGGWSNEQSLRDALAPFDAHLKWCAIQVFKGTEAEEFFRS